ncbi:MAG TPA: tRNA 2-thiouridine(34) synthase MnmA [Polyangia bacterium]|nr:tRNA 2-thiouridine(34) synthase MnmA [Polyangia bacterium]
MSPAAPPPLTVVALSGGVDSATAAALLVEAGERVVGISMRLYDARGTSASAGGRCCGPRDLEDARQVCAHLGIPFYVANYSAEFAAAVIDDFVNEYAAGRTPNPCARCNQHIKFTPLLRRALALGATSLVTGHYARILQTPAGPCIGRARDAQKDQSYFLFGMPRQALDYVRFPLGELTKEEVRAHARRFGLPNAGKEESQEICFVPDGDHAALVARRKAMLPGSIVDTSGQVLGQHEGIHRYTIGQRRGLGSLTPARPGEPPAPRYVVALDARASLVVVGDAAALERRECRVGEVVWWQAPGAQVTAQVQIRHRHPPRPARLTPLGTGEVHVEFEAPERAVAPGQAAVFYDGDRVIGGGFING